MAKFCQITSHWIYFSTIHFCKNVVGLKNPFRVETEISHLHLNGKRVGPLRRYHVTWRSLSKRIRLDVFLKMGHPRALFRLFSVFLFIFGLFLFSFFFFYFAVFLKPKSTQFLQQINLKRWPSSILCWDSNPLRSYCESHPITTRQGLNVIAMSRHEWKYKKWPCKNAGSVKRL